MRTPTAWALRGVIVLLGLTGLVAACGDETEAPSTPPLSAIATSLRSPVKDLDAALAALGYSRAEQRPGGGNFFGVVPATAPQANLVYYNQEGGSIAALVGEVEDNARQSVQEAALRWARQVGVADPVVHGESWFFAAPKQYTSTQRDVVGWLDPSGYVLVVVRTQRCRRSFQLSRCWSA